jgi:hypothetical protein
MPWLVVFAETVAYVANIFKYYIAYKLVSDREIQRLKATEEIKGAQ